MRTIAMRRSALFCLSAVSAALAAVPSHAQVNRSTDNPSWEANDPPGANPTYRIYNNADVPGWDSTTGRIEIWDSGFQSVPAAEGLRFAELNATTNGSTYQQFCLVNGDEINWAFFHRKRPGGPAVQNVTLEVADLSGNVLQVLASNATTNTSSWDFLQGTSAPFTGTTGLYRIQFSTTNPGSYGNFLDGMDMNVTPHVEFGLNDTSSNEGEASPSLPTIVVNGKFDVATSVSIQVVGGTATLGSDFQTPTGTAAWTVTVPAGDYDGTEFPIGVTILDEGTFDAGETIQFELSAVANVYDLVSTQTCGGAPKQTATHTIFEASDLVTEKTLTSSDPTPVAGETVTFTITARNTGPSTATAVSLTDLLPAGLTPTLGNGAVSQGSYDTGTGLWTIGSIANGGSATLTLEGVVNGGQGGATITNTTTAASGNQTDPSTAGDDLTESVTIIPSFDLEVRKTNTPGVNGNVDQASDGVITGSTTTYTINATNNGPDDAIGAIVTDTPGSGITCDAASTVSLSGDGVPAGSFTFADLSGSGITLETLTTGQTATLTYSCQVN
ncbi:Glycoprotein gp2 [Altererythrobacter insulae]|nr:Glycoprotein gp2 [Altererythrobacter insulae]